MKAIKGEYTLEISGRLKKKGERVGFGAGSTHTLTQKNPESSSSASSENKRYITSRSCSKKTAIAANTPSKVRLNMILIIGKVTFTRLQTHTLHTH